MITGESIICFAGEDWWYHHPHSKNHIMKRLARAGNTVVFVNSISMGLPSLGSPDLFHKIKRKLASYAKLVRKTEEGIVVLSPIVLPFYSSRTIRRLNRLLLFIQFRLLSVALEMRRPVLWIAIPTASDLVGRLGESALIYQVSDKYDANKMDHAISGEIIRAMHERLLQQADLVYYSGRKLYQEAIVEYPATAHRSKLLEQAVDFEHFSKATGAARLQIPDDIAAIRPPRLGYFGAVDSWIIDQALVRYVASKRPDWNWIFLGLRARALDIESLPSVHYLGSKPYAEMPAYAAAFDVCVLPWVTDNEFVNYGSAIKVREYLATGKPVVITPLYEYESLDGILRIARGYDDFIAKVESALCSHSTADRRTRQQAVESSTWDARTEAVSDDISRLIRIRR
jgi:glycosyltransferase involved in cell wall biosynthesis